MAELEYTLPAKIVITNLKTEDSGHTTDLWNTGLSAVETGEALSTDVLEDFLPPLNTKKYAGTVQIPIYSNRNQYYTLAPEESITVTATTDAEAIFYLQFAEEGVLSVEVTKESTDGGEG